MAKAAQFPKLGVSACVWQGTRVLIVERAKAPMAGFWSLPGGHVEPGETVKQAALRELQEETGIEASLDHLAGLFDLIAHDDEGQLQIHYVIACYTGRWTKGVAKAHSDAASVLWADRGQLEDRPFTPGVREAIAAARDLLKL